MPLSPLPSPSHRPGEGDSSEAVVTIGCLFVALPILKPFPTATIASTAFPSPGRREGDGRGDRGEVSGGGALERLRRPASSPPSQNPDTRTDPHPAGPAAG